MVTSMKTQCSPRLTRNLGCKLYQEVPLENECDLTKAKCWDVNEQIYVRIYIRNLHKDEVHVLTMQM